MKIKKDNDWAVEQMSDWLVNTAHFGKAPIACEVVWSKKIPWNGSQEKVFLVRYKMDEGYEMVGFTGPITWSFYSSENNPVISLQLLEALDAKENQRWQRLVNLYAGWFYCTQSADLQESRITLAKEEIPELLTKLHERKYLSAEHPEDTQRDLYQRKYITFFKNSMVDMRESFDSRIPYSGEATRGNRVYCYHWQECRVECVEISDSIWLDDRLFCIAKVDLYYDTRHNTFMKEEGIMKAEQYLLITLNEEKEILTVEFFPLDEPIYSHYLLYHWIGTHYGPYLLYNLGGLTYMFDRLLKAGFLPHQIEKKLETGTQKGSRKHSRLQVQQRARFYQSLQENSSQH
ncbi:hypothetical protein BKI52_08315 [marine bacterium AO1-C]|nr:hypothetical protein BKI52_08315 [marine bacterium AO1-C]